jgi:hypothetical protein
VLLILAFDLHVKLVDQGIDWPAWITAGFTAVAALGVLFALWSLKDAKRTRHGMLMTEISRQWSDPVVVESLKLYGKHSEKRLVGLVDLLFGPPGETQTTDDDRNVFSSLAVLANLIESMGVLVSETTITDEIVYKMWGGTILVVWEAWDEAIPKLRKYDGEPDTFKYFESIAHAMQRISAREKARHAREEAKRAKKAKRAKQAATGGSASSDPQAGAKAEPGKNGQT